VPVGVDDRMANALSNLFGTELFRHEEVLHDAIFEFARPEPTTNDSTISRLCQIASAPRSWTRAVMPTTHPFENMIDGAIGLALSNQVEMRHHVVDLFGRSRQEKPAINVSALHLCICIERLRVIVFGIDRARQLQRGLEVASNAMNDARLRSC
jgi:hypothetical protein